MLVVDKVSPRQNAGGVLVEFVVITSFVILPLIYGVTLLGKYTDNRQKLEVSARYAAWERTVWYQNVPKSLKNQPSIKTKKTAAQIQSEIKHRIFSQQDTSIYNDQKNGDPISKVDPMQNLLWFKDGKKQLSIYTSNKPKSGSAKDKNNPPHVVLKEQSQKSYGLSKSSVGKVFSLLDKFGDFDLDVNGVYKSSVSVPMEIPIHFAGGFDQTKKELLLERHNTLLTDGWNSAGPKQASSRVKSLVPLDKFDNKYLNTARKYIAKLPMAEELSPKVLKFGHVEIDAVRPDNVGKK